MFTHLFCNTRSHAGRRCASWRHTTLWSKSRNLRSKVIASTAKQSLCSAEIASSPEPALSLNQTTEDSYTSSQGVSVIPPAINHRATSQRPINGAEAGLIRRSYVARPFMAGDRECASVVWFDLVEGAPRNDSSPLTFRSCPSWKRAAALLLLPPFVVLFSPTVIFAQTSTLTVIDNEPVDIAPGEPGPGDNMVFSVRRNATYVVTLSFTTGQPGEFVTHILNRDGTLDLVGRTPGGVEPRAIAMARNGDYVVVANSAANQIAVMSIGEDGVLREVSRTSSGGLNPYDVAVGFNDIVVVANRDSDQINTFHIDRRGRLTPLALAWCKDASRCLLKVDLLFFR
ncbi:MAG: lactonase family protein [Deltaproteobacteria bacterium]|nr:lactonase family protein [Deltaproteobacteria bacterium]